MKVVLFCIRQNMLLHHNNKNNYYGLSICDQFTLEISHRVFIYRGLFSMLPVDMG